MAVQAFDLAVKCDFAVGLLDLPAKAGRTCSSFGPIEEIELSVRKSVLQRRKFCQPHYIR
jgi:hypothetical protein